MKIVHVVEPFASGISTFILQLTNHIDDEHIVIHGVRKESQIIEHIKATFPPNTTFIEWSKAKREINLIKDLSAAKELYKLLKQHNPDIIHLHSSKAGVIGRILTFIMRKKNVVYTPNAVSFLRTDVGKFKRMTYVAIEKISSFLHGQIVSSSIDEQQVMQTKKIESILIHNGVDFSDYAFKTTSQFKVVTCGRITIQKDPAAFNRIASMFTENPAISFVWIGSGELESELISPNIKITGWLDKESVKRELLSASLYISTSEWEGLSLASLEAMSIGLPMILSNKCGNTELIDDKKNGFLYTEEIQVVQKIKELVSNSDLLIKQSQASRTLYEDKFTGKICAEKYRVLYSKIVAKNGK
jgi:glycosyltransferase involved in cell wall biosynthesis